MSDAEDTFALHLDVHDIQYRREYRFHPERRWRFDFALPSEKIAIEIEGAVWTGGRHTRGSGFVKDMEKYNHASLLGWRVLRFSPDQVDNGLAIEFVQRMLGVSDE